MNLQKMFMLSKHALLVFDEEISSSKKNFVDETVIDYAKFMIDIMPVEGFGYGSTLPFRWQNPYL